MTTNTPLILFTEEHFPNVRTAWKDALDVSTRFNLRPIIAAVPSGGYTFDVEALSLLLERIAKENPVDTTPSLNQLSLF